MDIIVPPEVSEASNRANAAAGAMPNDACGAIQYLTFRAAGDTYAMSIVATKAIIEHAVASPNPLMPNYICGVIDFKGMKVPVVDITARLGFHSTKHARRHCSFVIVEMSYLDESFYVAVAVEGVKDVLALHEPDLKQPSSADGHIRSDFIQALTRIHGHYVIVMHLEQVLLPEEVAELAGIGGCRALCWMH